MHVTEILAHSFAPILGTFCIFLPFMRIIALSTLRTFWDKYADAKGPLQAWHREARRANWANPNELKKQFGNASIVGSKRVVFNIEGNAYRLIVDIEYSLKIIFVVWVGTHHQFDSIDVKKVAYVKAY